MKEKNSKQTLTHAQIIEKLETVYDPEFPLIDIYTLGLIYEVQLDHDEKVIFIEMTFTTPACPMADMIEAMVRNAIQEIAAEYSIVIEITFEPMRTPDMIRDKDLQRMFM